MASKQYQYLLSTPDYRPGKNEVLYNYQRTKNIHLNFTHSGFSITLTMTVKKNMEDILSSDLFRDAIKKATILRLIVYNNTQMSQLICRIEDKEEVIYDQRYDETLYWLMCNDHLRNRMPDQFKNKDFYQFFASMNKSHYERRIAALYAYILAKSKIYETERFTYLWLAMGGVFEYLSDVVRKNYLKDINKDNLSSEGKEIAFMSYYLGKKYYSPKAKAPEDTPKSEKRKVETKLKNQIDCKYREGLIRILDQVTPELFNETIEAIKKGDLQNIYVQEINNLLEKYSLEKPCSIYTFVMLWLSYQIRCNYFHSDKAFMLFAYTNESPIGTISILNALLEDYLDENLYKWLKPDDQLQDEMNHIIDVASKVFPSRIAKSGNITYDISQDELEL